MKFYIEYDNQNLKIEAESAVQAIIKVMDFVYNFSYKIDFNITEVQDNFLNDH